MKILAFLVPFYYEFLANFVPKKVEYEITGECLKCAKCCRYIHCAGLGSEIEFKFLQLIYPEYRKFKVAGKDENDNFVLICSLIDKDNLCPIYLKRPCVCKNYPNLKKYLKEKLH